MAVQSWPLHLLRSLRRSLPDGGDQTVARIRTGSVEEEDFLQQSRFALCNCRVCNRPFAVQKEIDYAIALLAHNGDSRAENHRESFETCPDCKRQKCLVPSDRIELTRHMKEVS